MRSDPSLNRRTHQRFAELTSAFENLRTGGDSLCTLAKKLIELAFRDLDYLGAGGMIVPQLGVHAGAELEFKIEGDEAAHAVVKAQAVQLARSRRSELANKTLEQELPSPPSAEQCILLITPVVSGFDYPIGMFWVSVLAANKEAALCRLEYVAKYVALAVRAEKACAAVEQLSESALIMPATTREIAQKIACSCRKALAASAVIVWVVDRVKSTLRTFATNSEPAGTLKVDMGLGEGLAGRCAKEGRKLVVRDLLDASELSAKNAGCLHHPAVVQQHGWRAAMMAPLDIGGEAAGVIAAYGPRASGFSKIDLDILCAFANRLSAGYANAERISHLTEMERRLDLEAPAIDAGRLAMENVHDAVNQLVHAQNYLSTAQSQVPQGSGFARDVEQATLCVNAAKKRISALTQLAKFDEIHKGKVVLKELLQGVIAETESEARRIRVNVLLQCPHELLVRLDAEKMQRVFSNFFSNSLWFLERDTKGKPKEIKIVAMAAEDGVNISFYDNGPGIAPYDIERVFDHLFTTRGNRGMGFGLAIAKRFVLAHGGSLKVCSKWGFSTEMLVHLPKADIV
jgi:signal transduction histidine kinase